MFFNIRKLIQIETIRSKNIFPTLAKNNNLVFRQRGSETALYLITQREGSPTLF